MMVAPCPEGKVVWLTRVRIQIEPRGSVENVSLQASPRMDQINYRTLQARSISPRAMIRSANNPLFDMTRSLLLLSAVLLALGLPLTSIGQTVMMSAADYDAAKISGTLPAGAQPIVEPVPEGTRPVLRGGEERGGGSCGCWVEPDNTYILALQPNDDGSSGLNQLAVQFRPLRRNVQHVLRQQQRERVLREFLRNLPVPLVSRIPATRWWLRSGQTLIRAVPGRSCIRSPPPRCMSIGWM